MSTPGQQLRNQNLIQACFPLLACSYCKRLQLCLAKHALLQIQLVGRQLFTEPQGERNWSVSTMGPAYRSTRSCSKGVASDYARVKQHPWAKTIETKDLVECITPPETKHDMAAKNTQELWLARDKGHHPYCMMNHAEQNIPASQRNICHHRTGTGTLEFEVTRRYRPRVLSPCNKQQDGLQRQGVSAHLKWQKPRLIALLA